MVIVFRTMPAIVETAVIAGPLEKKSTFHTYFDVFLQHEKGDEKTHEKGQAAYISLACQTLLQKAGIKNLDVDYFLSGDLVNQMTPTNFAARELAVSFIGLFSACATSVSSLIIASLLTELGASQYAIAGASSQHSAVERQFRYPTLYGTQKPATSQWTVSAAGYALVTKKQQGFPSIVAATVGKVVDYEESNPLHMGGAMAPAAFSTIAAHLKKRGQRWQDYDLIMTGDLGHIGLKALKLMLLQDGIKYEQLKILRDGGAEFYGEQPFFQAGASGAGCSSAVYLGYVFTQLKKGIFKRVLLVATGALLSPLTFQQGETIPCTAHAVEIVMEKE